jgi:uncharacterized SAM-binding protein YcdF (DUF218 family)
MGKIWTPYEVNAMFVFKKFLSPFLIPPGLFILILTISGLWLCIRKSYKVGIFNLFVGGLIWFASITPVSDFMMRPLEAGFTIPKDPKGDVIIVLGGGAYDHVRDLSGTGFPAGESLGRLVTAARLQKSMKTPVIVSSGQVNPQRGAEAPIARRLLTDLGIPHDKVIAETKSRDTIENARYTQVLCRKLGYKNPIVVTSAYHMKRALLSFQKVGLTVQPFPANFRTGKKRPYVWEDYLPNLPALETFSAAMREYIGLVFYQWIYFR